MVVNNEMQYNWFYQSIIKLEVVGIPSAPYAPTTNSEYDQVHINNLLPLKKQNKTWLIRYYNPLRCMMNT